MKYDLCLILLAECFLLPLHMRSVQSHSSGPRPGNNRSRSTDAGLQDLALSRLRSKRPACSECTKQYLVKVINGPTHKLAEQSA